MACTYLSFHTFFFYPKESFILGTMILWLYSSTGYISFYLPTAGFNMHVMFILIVHGHFDIIRCLDFFNVSVHRLPLYR